MTLIIIEHRPQYMIFLRIQSENDCAKKKQKASEANNFKLS